MIEQWTAWTDYFNSIDRSAYVKYCENQGWFYQRTEYPPGHSKFTLDTPAFLVRRA